MKVTTASELAFSFPDKPGVLASTGKAFAQAGINMAGMLNVTNGDTTTTRMVIMGDTTQAKQILESNGARDITKREILSVHLEGKPGALAHVAEKLAAANINVGDLYASEVPGSNAVIYCNTSDNAKALTVLR